MCSNTWNYCEAAKLRSPGKDILAIQKANMMKTFLNRIFAVLTVSNHYTKREVKNSRMDSVVALK